VRADGDVPRDPSAAAKSNAIYFCGTCGAAFIFQSVRNAGISLETLCAIFPAASKALDAPPASELIQ